VTSRKKPQGRRKRLGRPPLPANVRKGVNLTFRARGDMRDWLRAVAEKSGRSISEEIEQILEAHRKGEDTVLQVLRALGGANASRIIKPLYFYFSSLEGEGIDWMHDADKANLVKRGIDLIIDAVLANKPLPFKEWMPRLIYRDTQGISVADDPLVRALVVLQSLGLAEIMEPKGPSDATP
jgi:hypothetical protein